MAIIIQNERIVDLSRMNVIRACLKYGRYNEYELRAFEDRRDKSDIIFVMCLTAQRYQKC